MLTAVEIAGFVGVGLAGLAYLPQIWHLVRVHCSAGISRLAFCAWLVASLLVTTHAIAIRAGVFIVLGAVQIVATTLILLYATKYASSRCASHVPAERGAETNRESAVATLPAAPRPRAPDPWGATRRVPPGFHGRSRGLGRTTTTP